MAKPLVERHVTLRYDETGDIADRRCPGCGSWASEHKWDTPRPGERLQPVGLALIFPDWDRAQCPEGGNHG